MLPVMTRNRPVLRHLQSGSVALDSTVHVSEERIIMQGTHFTQAVSLSELDSPTGPPYNDLESGFNDS